MPLVLNSPTCSGCGSERGGCTCHNRAPNAGQLQTFLAYNQRWDAAARDRLHDEAPEDFAGPNKSFPIRDQEDVDHAARLIGHADDPGAVKARIIAIAKRKGLSLPDAWNETETSGTENRAMFTTNEAERTNADTYSGDYDLDGARVASKKAALFTIKGLPAEDDDARTDLHDQLARHTLKALKRVQRSDMAGAAASHTRAADILDKFSLQSLENGGNGKFEDRAGNMHREAARVCGMVNNARHDGPIPCVNQTAYFAQAAAPGLLGELHKLGVANEQPDSSWADAAPGPGVRDALDEEDRMYDMDDYGKPVRTLDPISALKEWLGMSFSEQENARKMGVESMTQGEHQYSFDYSGPAPARNVRQERPRYSGFEGLANMNTGPTMNDAREPIPTPNFTEMLVQNASAGLLRALGKGAGLVANVPPPAESPTANYNAPLTVNGSFAPDSPIPTQTINWQAAASPGLMRALGKL
jgi:hypothetical protein